MKCICGEHRFVCICLRRESVRVFLDESVPPALQLHIQINVISLKETVFLENTSRSGREIRNK